jgi:Ni2+-binding GTPase involved in maturation of urease and hydrogenase
MKALIVAGPPSAGKTAVIIHAARRLLTIGELVAAVKFDTRSSLDPEMYAASLGIPVIGGL